jgi:hypothetical protein
MDALLAYRFNRLSSSEASNFSLQSQLLRDEVELGGETQVGYSECKAACAPQCAPLQLSRDAIASQRQVSTNQLWSTSARLLTASGRLAG